MPARVVTTAAALADATEGRAGLRAVVMTMGALHDGHVELVRTARQHAGAEGSVIVTVFVNPTQFGAGEDYEVYPRSLESDVALADAAGADIVLAPDATEVYGAARGFRDDSVTLDPGYLGGILEGASRPGHFRGVLTVVAKLIGMTRPDVAVFGEKDYQQLVLVRRMTADLRMGVSVIGVPTVREPDGLALSSRNRFLSEPERVAAAAIPRALEAAEVAAVDGAEAAALAGRAVLAQVAGVDLDYLVVVDPELGEAPDRGLARALVAARVGSTRLIDNRAVVIGR